ncbi:7-dehydrocholesterol reductase-like isoform X1 [Humulus lupulus]|uniref:7-dehydrocholesterol reductase-like isoform X1 n=1 Tax=Humulus lupulus TaxID=3486 RepID=UPI002B40204E|nr:7-dehydrocholesterol reductase-like isoform X1 [Humulus lupulus]
MYLVNHPVHLGTQLALYILVAGILCIYINYDCDRQRQEFRRTNGKALVWGKAPSKITATYTTTTGETKSSILLTSGWYGKYWKSYCEKVRYRVIPGIYGENVAQVFVLC